MHLGELLVNRVHQIRVALAQAGVVQETVEGADVYRSHTGTTFSALKDSTLVATSSQADIAGKVRVLLQMSVVLTYGGYRALHGQTEVGVLAAFLLYLRRFFDPMQDLAMFYTSFQSATLCTCQP